MELPLARAIAAGHSIRAAHAAEVSWICGGGHAYAGAGDWCEHSDFQLDRRCNAAVAAGREPFPVGPAEVERAQSAKLSRLHDFRRLSDECNAWGSKSLRLFVLRTTLSRNSASKCLFGDGGHCQLWQVELVRQRPCDGYQWPVGFRGLFPDDGPQTRRRPAARSSGRHAVRRTRCRAELWLLAERLRRLSRCRRSND